MENILEKITITVKKKKKMKIFNYLCKIANDFKFRSQKLQTFLFKKRNFYFYFDISADIKEIWRVCGSYYCL